MMSEALMTTLQVTSMFMGFILFVATVIYFADCGQGLMGWYDWVMYGICRGETG